MEWVESMESKRKMSSNRLWCLYTQLTWQENHSVRSEAPGKRLLSKVMQSITHCEGKSESQLTSFSTIKGRAECLTEWGHGSQNTDAGIGIGWTDFLSCETWNSAEGTLADRGSFLVWAEGGWELPTDKFCLLVKSDVDSSVDRE